MVEVRRSLLLRIWREHLSRYRGRFALALLFMVGLAGAEAGFVLVTEWIFAGLEPGRSSRFGEVDSARVMFWGPILIVAFAIIQAMCFYLQAVTAQSAGVSVLKDLQNRMFGAIQRFDLLQLQGRGDGEARIGGLVSRFTNDMTVLRETFTRVPNAVRDVVRLIGFVSVLLFLDPVLFICVLLIYPLIGIPITYVGQRIRRLARSVQAQIGDMTSVLTESLSGQAMVKSYTLEKAEEERLGAIFEERRRLLVRLVRLRVLNEPMITVISAVAVAIIIGVAAFRIDAGYLTGPELVAFLIAMALLSQPARGLGTLNAVLQEGLAAIERVFSVVDEQPAVTSPASPEPLRLKPGEAPEIKMRGVSFAYQPGAATLQDIDLRIAPGSTTALVGPSGSGKSTLFGLVPRFFDPVAGEVEIGGQPVTNIPLSDLRQAIALVSQTPVLFDLTIEENIRLGRPDKNHDDVVAAAKAAAAHDFIMRLDQGYSSRVGEGGNALSGGERQRIALARAFLKDAPILLLDEATSALDAESERLVGEAMDRLRQGRTTLIIAHRLSTIRNADAIAVMERGRIIELGSHDDLLARGGLYAHLAGLQGSKASSR